MQGQTHISSKIFGQFSPTEGLILQWRPSVWLWTLGGIRSVFKNQHLDSFQKCMTGYEITFKGMKYKLKPLYLFSKYLPK